MADPFEADELLTVKLPSGEHVFELGVNTKRWHSYRGKVQFETKLKLKPSSIEFKNVQFDGAADLYVVKINKKMFKFQVTATSNGNSGGVNAVSFEWEAKA